MRKTCLVCGAPLMDEPLIICDHMPAAAQHLPDPAQAEADQPITLRLRQCAGCGLVQLDSEPVGYYRDVIRSGGYSTTMHRLRHEQYARFLAECPVEGKRVVEVGCGQGEFLRVWREDGFPVEAFGIEHDPHLAALARKDGLNVTEGFAEPGYQIPGGPYDAFCSFNFLEHQPDPSGMLRSIYDSLAERAWGLITVPAWEYILEKESYYELIRDHIAYYSEDTFRFVLEKNGFRVLSMRVVNRDTWEAIVEKKPPIDASALRRNHRQLREETDALIARLASEGKRLAVWGASHQGLTILSSMELRGRVAYVIDSAPFKQGKVTTGSHIPIVSREHFHQEPVQAILIIAPGYTDEIAGLIRRELSPDIDIYTLRSNHLEPCHGPEEAIP